MSLGFANDPLRQLPLKPQQLCPAHCAPADLRDKEHGTGES
jgi:hypothetical protein